MVNLKQTFVIELDDWAALKPGERELAKMKEHYPDFKVTLFTTPFHPAFITKDQPIEKLYEWGKIVEANKDWMEIALHGFVHSEKECVTTRAHAQTTIRAAENVLKKIGVSFVKVWKAPHWQMNQEFEQVLKEMGYVKAIDRNNPEVFTDIPTYVWNWSIETPVPQFHTIKGHGHVFGTNNGIDTALPNLLTIPTDAKFMFVSEYLKQEGISVERVVVQ